MGENWLTAEIDPPVASGTGLIALDVVIESGEQYDARCHAGGTCGNVLAILSFLGWKAFPVARMGNDDASAIVRNDLLRWGVELKYIATSEATRTPVIVHRIRREGDTAIHRFSLKCPWCGSWLPTFRPLAVASARDVVLGDWRPRVFFMDRVSQGAIVLARAARERGSLVVFEPSRYEDSRQFSEALELAHVVKYARDRIEGIRIPSMSRPFLQVETFGSRGLRYRGSAGGLDHTSWRSIDAFRVPRVRDAAGSGDWCTAGVIHKLGQEGSETLEQASEELIRDALLLGQALAAWNCGFVGARGGMYQVTPSVVETAIEGIMQGESVHDDSGSPQGSISDGAAGLACHSCHQNVGGFAPSPA